MKMKHCVSDARRRNVRGLYYPFHWYTCTLVMVCQSSSSRIRARRAVACSVKKGVAIKILIVLERSEIRLAFL